MRVLCINGDFSNAGERSKYLMSVPKELEMYTIKDIVHSPGGDGYILEEIFGGILPNGKEISFRTNRFVRIEEIDTLEEEITKEECLTLQ